MPPNIPHDERPENHPQAQKAMALAKLMGMQAIERVAPVLATLDQAERVYFIAQWLNGELAHWRAAVGDEATRAIVDGLKLAADGKLAESEKREWRPVTDTSPMPEVGTTVLFCDSDRVVHKGCRQVINKGEAWVADDDVDGMPMLGVTHWMPLPEAPVADHRCAKCGTTWDAPVEACPHCSIECSDKLDGWCPRCKGSGEAKGMTQGHGPDDYEVDIPCPECNGTGAGPAPLIRSGDLGSMPMTTARMRPASWFKGDVNVVEASFAHELEFSMEAALKEVQSLKPTPSSTRPPNSTQEQAGVDAYTRWKANVGNERSSAYGGNLHDLARRMYEAMTNAAPQERSAEASSRADGEASAAKKPGATASTPCQPGEAETPCGAAPASATADMVPLGTISQCPSCEGDGKLTTTPGQFGTCWRCGGSGRVMAYSESESQFKARMEKVRAFTAACNTPPEGVAPDMVLVPRELTAGSKFDLSGEFTFKCCGDMEATVPWDTVKEIHRRVVALFVASPPAERKL